MSKKITFPPVYYFLIALMFFQGVSGLYGGSLLVFDPSGELLKLPLLLLESTPFNNYLFPGIILLLILGIIPTIVAYGLWHRYTWAWTGALFVSFALIIWIGVQIGLIGYRAQPPLQVIYGLLGFIMLFTLFAPGCSNVFRFKAEDS